MVARDNQATGVGHAPADLGQPLVGGLEHPADPFPRGVERRPPGLRDLVLGHRRAQGGGDLVADPGAPAHLAGVGQEDNRPDHAVLQRGPVAVHVVRGAALAAARLVDVGDERDRVGVAAERRAGQRQPAAGRLERLLDRLAPGQRVARVVDLVEDDQGAAVLSALPVQRRVRRDLRVGDGHAVEVGADPALGVPVGGVDGDAEPGCRLRPLVLEVFGRRDHGERGDLAPGQQFRGDRERVGGLPRPGRGDQQEVTPGQLEVLVIGILLPPAKTKKKIIPNGTLGQLRDSGAGSRGAHEADMLPGGADPGGQPPGTARLRGAAIRSVSRHRCRPEEASRRFPCRWGRPGSASGPGSAPTPCRTAP